MSINALAFVVIFLSVAFNYRLAADDYHHAYMVAEHGIWDAMVYYYDNWNPRWSSILVTNSFLQFATNNGILFLFHVCSLILGGFSIFSLLSGLSKKLQLPFSNTQITILSVYCLAIIFYSSFSKTDTWYWITVNPMYLWGTFTALLGGSLLIQNWNRIIRYLLIISLFLYVGGASESAALSSLVALIFLGLITKNPRNETIERKALHLATVACMVGFGIAMMGDGIQIRREHLPDYTAQDRLLVGMWNYIRFNLYEIPKRLPLLVIAVAPLGFFGRKHLRFQLISIKDVFWSNKKLWFLADLTIAALAIAIGWVMCEMGPHRTWFPLTIIVVTVAVALAYQLGSWVYIISKGQLFKLVLVAQVLFLGYQVYEGVTTIPTTQAYASAHDSRSEMILDNLDKTSLLVPPLPDSKWLLSGDISTDPNHFTNKHLSLFFGLNQGVIADSTLTSER